MKSRISLDDIRNAIMAVKRINACTASELTAEMIRAELNNKGSNSTSGPLIRSMMDEAILAEHLDYGNLSNRLKAAFMAELKRAADDISTDLRKQLADNAHHNDELREINATINSELCELKVRSSEDQTIALNKISSLEQSLAGSEAKASTFDDIKQNLTSQLAETKTDLAEKREEISTLKNDLRSVRDIESKTAQKFEELTTRLKDSEDNSRLESQRKNQAEQGAVLLKERVDELKTDNHRLSELNTKLTADIDRLREDLLKTAEAKADASARLEEISKAAAAPRSNRAKRKTDKGSNNAKIGT